MRWLNPSAVLNFRKPSMALAKESETLDFDVPGELRFTPKAHSRVRNSSIFGKMSTAVCRALALRPFGDQKTVAPGTTVLVSSEEWIRLP